MAITVDAQSITMAIDTAVERLIRVCWCPSRCCVDRGQRCRVGPPEDLHPHVPESQSSGHLSLWRYAVAAQS